MEMFDNIVVKDEVDLDFIAEFYSDENTQNSQCSLAKTINSSQSATTNIEETSKTNENDEENLQKLLKEFDLEILYTTLKLNDITYRSLRFLSSDDINTVIRNVAYRAEFREKLFAWRENKYYGCNNSILFSDRGTQSMSVTLQQMSKAAVFNNQTAPAAQQTSIIVPTSASQIQHQTSFENRSVVKPTTKIIPITKPERIIRSSPCRRNATEDEEFPSSLPGGSGITKRKSNTPTAILRQSVDMEETVSNFTRKITIPSSASTSTSSATATKTSSQQSSKPISPKSINERDHLRMDPKVMSCFKVDVQKVLNTNAGRTIIEHYNKNGYFVDEERNAIVRLIIEDVMQRGETLSPKDFRAIKNDIITIFPNEKVAADYYFIFISGKKNPNGGRLYHCYTFKNSKRRKLARRQLERLIEYEECTDGDYNSDESSSVYPQDMPGTVPKVDEMTALALKQLFSTDHFNWEEVCDKWIHTWALRRKELLQSGVSELLTNWVKLTDPRAAELFKIDFCHVYPEKENLLFAKWDDFIKKSSLLLDKKQNYYDLKKLHKYCKLGIATKDEQDFLNAIGLTVLLPSNSLFKDEYGHLKIRATIDDSIDSFVMRLNSLDAYKSHLRLYNHKFDPVNRTIHPFLVVISPNELHISKIYVALDNNFYCMKSFLQALDLCYKIYHTCDLKYPTMCENVWTFIQRYFYDMIVPWDARSTSLASLIASLNVINI